MKDGRKIIVHGFKDNDVDIVATGDPIKNSPEWQISVARDGQYVVVGTSSQWANPSWREMFMRQLAPRERYLADLVFQDVARTNRQFNLNDVRAAIETLQPHIGDDDARRLFDELHIIRMLREGVHPRDVSAVTSRHDLIMSHRHGARYVPWLVWYAQFLDNFFNTQ